jgi:hypothetical protein
MIRVRYWQIVKLSVSSFQDSLPRKLNSTIPLLKKLNIIKSFETKIF